mmetsp:Transcript_8371/g.12206  ORF Transcript_8371/g.12206 Transcript_8371/m.12206 type:complete len:242 (+) Transcript_8371:304-1029(+)
MKLFYTMAILAAAGLLHKGVCADKAKIADVAGNIHVDQVVRGAAKRYTGDESVGLRTLRGSPTNRRRVVSDANIDVVENKLRTLATDGRELQENDNATVAFLSIKKKDGKISCKGILLQPDWIMTSGRCADGALNITALIGVNETSTLADGNITADSEVERHFITQADIKMSPGFNSSSDDNFAMLHLNVASNKTAALESSDFETTLEKGWHYVSSWSYDWYWGWYETSVLVWDDYVWYNW